MTDLECEAHKDARRRRRYRHAEEEEKIQRRSCAWYPPCLAADAAALDMRGHVEEARGGGLHEGVDHPPAHVDVREVLVHRLGTDG